MGSRLFVLAVSLHLNTVPRDVETFFGGAVPHFVNMNISSLCANLDISFQHLEPQRKTLLLYGLTFFSEILDFATAKVWFALLIICLPIASFSVSSLVTLLRKCIYLSNYSHASPLKVVSGGPMARASNYRLREPSSNHGAAVPNLRHIRLSFVVPVHLTV